MAEAKLVARVETEGVKKASTELDKFAKSGENAEKSTGKLQKIAKGAPKAIAAIGAAAAAAGAAVVIMARNAAAAQKELEALARVAGVSAEEFQALAFATETVGISGEKLSDISKDVNEKLGEFIATGGGGFKDFFEEVAPLVGVTAEELQNLSGPEVLQRVKNALDDANISLEEQSFFLESIASDTTLLIPLLEKEGEALAKLTKRYDETAGALSLTVAESQSLEELSKTFDLLDETSGNAAKKISATLSPVLNDFFNSVIDSAPKATEAIIDFVNSIIDPKNIVDLAGVNKEIGETAEQIAFLKKRINDGEADSLLGKLFSSEEADKRFLAEAEKRLVALIERSNELTANIAKIDKPGKTKKTGSKTVDKTAEEAAKRAADAQAKVLDQARAEAELFLTNINKAAADPIERVRLEENEQLALLEYFFENSLIGWQDYYTARTQIQEEAEKKRNEIALAETQATLQSGEQLFSGLTDLVGEFGSKQSNTYKALFAVQKAFSIAQAVLNLSTAASQALADPSAITPAQKFTNVALVTTEALNLVNAIRSAKFDARQQGGQFSAGQKLLVGEKGPELVQFGTNGRIANTTETQSLLSSTPQITIINQTTGRIDKTETQTDDRGNTILIVQEVLNREVLDPNSRFNKNLDRTRKVQRAF